MTLFFSFSTLTHDQLSSFVGDTRVIGAAILPGHTVRFGGRSRMHGGTGVASLSPSANKEVLGIVFKLKKTQLDLLDLYHECHLGLTQRVPVNVDDGQHEHSAFTYTLKEGQARTAASPAYKEMHKKLVHEAFELFRKQQNLGY
jgi:hypothetical protein